jgi:DNA repair exonuclease SbcCD ATPase subunit
MKKTGLFIIMSIGVSCVYAQQSLLKLDDAIFDAAIDKIVTSKYSTAETQALFKLECQKVFKEYQKKASAKITMEDYESVKDQSKQNEKTSKEQQKRITTLEGRVKEIDALRKQIKERDSLLTEQRKQIKTSEKRVKEIDALKKQIGEKDILLARKDSLLMERDTVLIEKDRTISNLKSDTTELNGKVIAIQNENNKSIETINRYNSTVTKTKDRIEDCYQKSLSQSLLTLDVAELQAVGDSYNAFSPLVKEIDAELDKDLLEKTQQLTYLSEVCHLAKTAVQEMANRFDIDKNKNIREQMQSILMDKFKEAVQKEFLTIRYAVEEQEGAYQNIRYIINTTLISKRGVLPDEKAIKSAQDAILDDVRLLTGGEKDKYNLYYKTFNGALEEIQKALDKKDMSLLGNDNNFIRFLRDLENRL